MHKSSQVVIELLTQAYFMEIETVTNYIANSINLEKRLAGRE